MKNDFNPMDEFKSEETTLNLFKEVMQFTLSPREFAALSFDVRKALHGYAVSIQREMYGEKKVQSVEVIIEFRTPKNWWQHFKQDNFPAWLLKRYPVEYIHEAKRETVHFDRTFVFPNAYVEGHHILGKFVIRDHHRIG